MAVVSFTRVGQKGTSNPPTLSIRSHQSCDLVGRSKYTHIDVRRIRRIQHIATFTRSLWAFSNASQFIAIHMRIERERERLIVTERRSYPPPRAERTVPRYNKWYILCTKRLGANGGVCGSIQTKKGITCEIVYATTEKQRKRLKGGERVGQSQVSSI